MSDDPATGGHGIPTLTIIQLALLLADHFATEEAACRDAEMSVAPVDGRMPR